MAVLPIASRREHRYGNKHTSDHDLATPCFLINALYFAQMGSLSYLLYTLSSVEHDISTRFLSANMFFFASHSKKLGLTFGMILASLQSSY
jgi:hypothetical protein